MSLVVGAPLAGTVTDLAAVPDPVFAGGLVGPGIAVDPVREDRATAVAPVDGRVSKIHPHAFVITAPQGHAVLVHLGLDTVGLEGRGFTLHVEQGDTVAAGDPVLTWSPRQVEAGGLNPVVPVIALEAQEPDILATPLASPGARVATGDPLLTWC